MIIRLPKRAPQDLVQLMAKSSNQLAKHIFSKDLQEMTAQQSKRPLIAGAIFKKQVAKRSYPPQHHSILTRVF